MLLQQDISGMKNRTLIGSRTKVIIDNVTGSSYIGRTERDAPEIDNSVIIKSRRPLKPGQILNATITGAEAYDLHAEIT